MDEKLLYDTFSAFGVILQVPKIMRDPDSGSSKGFAFISYASFEASDAAIEAMNGQYLCNRPIQVTYAFKKESKGERHGSAAERLLAAKNPLSLAARPHTIFADAPSAAPAVPPVMMPPPPPPPPTAPAYGLTAMGIHAAAYGYGMGAPPPPPVAPGFAGLMQRTPGMYQPGMMPPTAPSPFQQPGFDQQQWQRQVGTPGLPPPPPPPPPPPVR